MASVRRRLSRFAAALMGALSLTLTSVPGAHAGASPFFFDGFEAGWSAWTQSPSNTALPNTTLVPDNSNALPTAPAGTTSAQVRYAAGTLDGGGFGVVKMGGAVFPTHFKVEYDFKLSPNFHYPLGQKMWRAMPNMNTGALGNDSTVNVQLNQYGTQWSVEVYSNSVLFGYTESVFHAGVPPVAPNTWHRLGVRIKANTFAGATPNADGEYELFIDGVSLGGRSGIRVAADASRWFRDFWGGPGNYTSSLDRNPIPADQWIRVDNFSVSDLTVASIAPDAPAAPPAPRVTTPAPDTTAPVVAFSAPAAGSTVAGSVQVKIAASDNTAVSTLKYYADGALIAVVSPPTPTFAWDSTTVADGSHTLAVTAIDAAGNSSQATLAVSVRNSVPTTLAVTAPAIAAGANGLVTVAASSAAGAPSGSVALAVDGGAPLTAALVNGQAQFSIPAPAVGTHTLAASFTGTGSFAASAASAVLTVNPTSGAIALGSSSYNATAIAYKTAITLFRSAPSASAVSVQYATVDGSAKSGVDYVAASGTVTFAAGATQQTVYVQILAGPQSSPRTFSVALGNAAGGAALGAPNAATITVGPAASASSLVAAFGLNQGAGTTDPDLSGRGSTLALKGAKWTGQARFGTALSFDGASTYAVAPQIPSLANWTISAWVQSPAAPAAASASGPIHRESNLQISWNHPDPRFRGAAAVHVNSGWYPASFGPLAANTWYYLTASYDGQTLRSYVNGVLVTSTAVPAAPAMSEANPFTLGKHAAFPQFFKGTVDEVRVYSRALSVTEIQRDMNLPL